MDSGPTKIVKISKMSQKYYLGSNYYVYSVVADHQMFLLRDVSTKMFKSSIWGLTGSGKWPAFIETIYGCLKGAYSIERTLKP